MNETSTMRKPHKMQYILNLTRCCTQDCEFCAVDALYSPSIEGCIELAHAEQLAGRELTPDQWCSVVEKLLSIDPTAEFDLSGGDCLALPWVSKQFIPFIMERVQSRQQVSVTSTATPLQSWLVETRAISRDKIPGVVHLTFDGYRPYSFDNIRLSSQIRELGTDIHVECPLNVENCDIEKVRKIYDAVEDAQVSELLLMRFFPTGRGVDKNGLGGLEPSDDTYRSAIAEFYRLDKQHQNGPAIKVQCALKQFTPQWTGFSPCKMGNTTWCVMPNGTLLICPWAYGMNGSPLSNDFVAGNILHDDYETCFSMARVLRDAMSCKYPRECRIHAFVMESKGRCGASQIEEYDYEIKKEA
ncbi:MAG: hypothetical protein WCX65_07290 [bacterium]